MRGRLFRFGSTLWLLSELARAATAAPVRNVPLVDQTGHAFQLYDLKGRYVLLTFVYTRCPLPKMCPLALSLSERAARQWNARADRKPLKVLAVTLDPSFDTPEVLRRYAADRRLDGNTTTLATGNAEAIAAFAGQFNVAGFSTDGSLLTHNLKHVLLAPDLSELREFADNEWAPETLIATALPSDRGTEAAAKAPASQGKR